MLINKQGKVVNVPPHVRSAEALAPLREVLIPASNKCGDMFKISTRARLRS